MDLKRKIGLCILLGLGFLYGTLFKLLKMNAYPKIPRAGIASLVKTIHLQTIRSQTRAQPDPTCEQCLRLLENKVLKSTRGSVQYHYMGTVNFTLSLHLLTPWTLSDAFAIQCRVLHYHYLWLHSHIDASRRIFS